MYQEVYLSLSPKEASMPAKPTPVDAYIAAFPAATQAILNKIRATVRKAVPDAEEGIGYGVIAFKKGGTYVIYLGGYPKHVALYPVYKGETAFADALKPYTSGTATAKFPLGKPIPYALITKIVEAKARENAERLVRRAAEGKGKARAAARAALAKPTRKAPAKAAEKSPAKAFKDMPNLSWSLLEGIAPRKSAGRGAKKAAKKSVVKKTKRKVVKKSKT
jgi:uncharacterized protein YdhG (YjbR/CyaY superfamily)